MNHSWSPDNLTPHSFISYTGCLTTTESSTMASHSSTLYWLQPKLTPVFTLSCFCSLFQPLAQEPKQKVKLSKSGYHTFAKCLDVGQRVPKQIFNEKITSIYKSTAGNNFWRFRKMIGAKIWFHDNAKTTKTFYIFLCFFFIKIINLTEWNTALPFLIYNCSVITIYKTGGSLKQ